MRRSAFIATIAAGLLLGACSKTEDTAPESRLFGNPPVIQNAALVQAAGVGTAVCDMSDALRGYFCNGGIPTDQINFPPITFTVQYTEALMSVQTTDPDSVTGQPNDILLVGASYQKSNTGGEISEATLVLFDDGSVNVPPFTIPAIGPEGIYTDCHPADDCGGTPVAPGEGRACSQGQYLLTSNDTAANDNTWTRGFALVTGTPKLTNQPTPNYTTGKKSDLASDCIALVRHEYPAISDVRPGEPVKFKIEVVDRAGNLTTWPQPLQAPLIQSTYTCTGDDCGCCWLISSLPDPECRGKPGLTGPGYPNGFCNSF
jgi:hypothetical protein